MKKLTLICSTITLIFFNSCNTKEGCTDELALNFDADADKNDGSCLYAVDVTLQVAATYDSAAYTSAPILAAAQGLVSNEINLPKNRPSGTNTPKEISKTELTNLYSVGNPSILSLATTVFKNTLENTLFTEYQINSKAVYDSVKINWTDLSQNPNGGMAGGYIMNKYGVEVEQLIVKGGFAGFGFNYVKNVLFADPNNLTQAQLDGALALYGSNPSFTFKYQSAKYTKDRKKGAETYHEAIALQFRKAQAAIKQNLNDEKTKAVNEIISLWEEGLMAQVIFYTYDVMDYFSKSNITDSDKAKGCHAWSEAAGIVMGFYQVNGKKISDAQVESYLNNINSSTTGLGKPYELIGSVEKLSLLQTAIDNIAAIYGLNKLDHKRN